MKTLYILTMFFSFSAVASVKPGDLDLTKGPSLVATYQNFYNSTDLKAVCTVYSDASALLIPDGILPYTKPVSFAVTKSELQDLLGLIKSETSHTKNLKRFEGFNGIPATDLELENGVLGAVYLGAEGAGHSGLRNGLDLVLLNAESQVGSSMRKLCGFGDDL